MKSLRQYLIESVHTYKYKIKIAGQTPKNFVEMFCFNLQKFDPVKIGDPKSTPIQKDPYGFPGLKDQPITIIDVDFKYPATEPMIKQIGRLLGYDENLIRMISANYDDSISQEAENYANQPETVLTSDYEEIPGAKEAAKEYGDSYLQSIKKQRDENNDEIEMPYAAKKTKDAFDPFDQAAIQRTMGKDSPMTKINRGPKPATNATKKQG